MSLAEQEMFLQLQYDAQIKSNQQISNQSLANYVESKKVTDLLEVKLKEDFFL